MLTCNLYSPVIHIYSRVIHLYSPVIHLYSPVIHLYSPVIHLYSPVIHLQEASGPGESCEPPRKRSRSMPQRSRPHLWWGNFQEKPEMATRGAGRGKKSNFNFWMFFAAGPSRGHFRLLLKISSPTMGSRPLGHLSGPISGWFTTFCRSCSFLQVNYRWV